MGLHRSWTGFFGQAPLRGEAESAKSSLVKAGLLPRLAPQVRPVYVEATVADTGARLLKALRRRLPDRPLRESLAAFRRGKRVATGTKLRIVLDQFEQWLNANREGMAGTDLATALRQADGERVQFLLLLRDDFWMGITRPWHDHVGDSGGHLHDGR